jgi:DNA polymerase-3 subunit gamma/tau
MRDAQSMLDQLVSFCGETINEANVLDVFGFTSREKVASLTQTLLARNNPAALSLIQKEAESGRELSQLLGELIGCLRALLVAKLDPSADGEGIPAHLWFAETEGRMKWATNKRLHFELGVIKAIQSLGEVRIADVIKVLTRGADFLPATPHQATPALPTPSQITPPAPEPEPEPVAEPIPDPIPESSPVAEPEPEPAAAIQNSPKFEPEPTPAPAPKPKSLGAIASLDSLIAAAPDVSELPPPEPPPWKNEAPAAEAPAPTPQSTPIIEDTFHNDPLIQAALVKFEGKILA